MYVSKLAEVRKLGDPVEARATNAAALPAVAASLRSTCQVRQGVGRARSPAGLEVLCQPLRCATPPLAGRSHKVHHCEAFS